MSEDARNSLEAWGSVLAVAGFFWAWLFLMPDLPRGAQPWLQGLGIALLAINIVRLMLWLRRAKAHG